jgi:Hsp20/alpha crystallin family
LIDRHQEGEEQFMAASPFADTAFAGKGRPAMETFMKNKHREEKKQGESSHEEIAYGRLERSLRLPGKIDADKIKASCDKGVLEITMPAPKELATKKVSVKVEAKK